MDSRGPASLDEEVSALSRGADRDSLFMQAGLTIPGHAAPVVVRVRNLSSGGMLAESAARVTAGAVVEVDLRNVGPVPGRIVWVGEGKFGVAFDRPVNPQAVRRQVVQKQDLPPHLSRLGQAGQAGKAIYRRR
ncbi:hypothetical protein FHR22_000428 [Sphingopyxis panaciterrae]|uniref:PilZ domain-containing protein n=1 Tax=Sphingopyxis panaciterrae TaxID=363841 RepID=UPI001420892D|nr:PilZ domain-containing protein [Sphingopyxis panaciterrae]NIJ35779.1 hypothetical protein [Sphingopyxis panaciterrae]